ncbi:unnamed protein product [Menidia menidia]|uniref:(Atlantic silverside) hypothetical protein n=1 Tax=Menidia menidia TaxID=238744 RepID=A0A8S4AC24_9TELE|nr:unnamed protein product [Menidia menidia]
MIWDLCEFTQSQMFIIGQDISKVQRIVSGSKSPANVGVMRRESGAVKECQMEKDISKVQRIVSGSKSPANVGVMRREIGAVKECQMEKQLSGAVQAPIGRETLTDTPHPSADDIHQTEYLLPAHWSLISGYMDTGTGVRGQGPRGNASRVRQKNQKPQKPQKLRSDQSLSRTAEKQMCTVSFSAFS